MRYRLSLVKINIINTFRHETAYFGENWSNILSTVFYTLALILFVEVLYSNVNNFAGYSKNEMMFLIFIGQLAFYSGWGMFSDNIEKLNEDIKTGALDFILIKPVPSLFFVSLRWFPILTTLRDSVPTLSIIFLIVDWTSLHLNPLNLFYGGIIFICGQVVWHCLRLILVFPAFWFGDASRILSITYVLQETYNLPFEGYVKSLRILFTTVLPIIISGAVCGSVILGKSDGFLMAGEALAVIVVFLFITNWLWKASLKRYTSASS